MLPWKAATMLLATESVHDASSLPRIARPGTDNEQFMDSANVAELARSNFDQDGLAFLEGRTREPPTTEGHASSISSGKWSLPFAITSRIWKRFTRGSNSSGTRA